MATEFKSSFIEAQAKSKNAVSFNINSELATITQAIQQEGPLPPTAFMNTIGSHDVDHFMSNMRFFALEIMARCQATPNSSFLDIGCGCGRMALPMTRFIGETGKYIGFDVWDEGITWCKENISSKYKNSQFFTISSKSNYYFSESLERIDNNYKLDFVDGNSVDIAFAVSVFTHLRKDDTLAYFKELGRVLRPGGVAYLTGFIIDSYFFDYVNLTGNHQAVKEDASDKGCYYAYSHQDFFAGYTMEVWNNMLRTSGLKIVCQETGSWAQKMGSRVYQDTFIVQRI